MIFVDTSAFYARLDRDDRHHSAAAATFATVAEDGRVVTHNYVVIETSALLRRRLGREATRRFLTDLLAPIEIAWVDRDLHAAATSAFLAGGGRVSLVDCASFEVMRREGLSTAFAFDRDFARQGFDVVP